MKNGLTFISGLWVKQMQKYGIFLSRWTVCLLLVCFFRYLIWDPAIFICTLCLKRFSRLVINYFSAYDFLSFTHSVSQRPPLHFCVCENRNRCPWVKHVLLLSANMTYSCEQWQASIIGFLRLCCSIVSGCGYKVMLTEQNSSDIHTV